MSYTTKFPSLTENLFTSNLGAGTAYTLENLYMKLAKIVHGQEADLNSAVDSIASSAGTVDQGTLLKVQGMVQSWGVTSGLATGTLRAAGDSLTKTTQNIR